MLILIIAGVVVLVLIFLSIGTYNNIVRSKNAAKQAWADVLTHERKKIKMFPELMEAAAGYMGHERDIMIKVSEARSLVKRIQDNTSPEELKQIQQEASYSLGSFRSVSENYPDLKASTLYKDLMRSIEETEVNIAAAVTIYNANVRHFNNAIQTFPADMVNAAFNRENPINEFTDTEASANFDYKPNFQ